MGAVMWGLVGWCGTKYPGWWRNPPPPDPEPWWRSIFYGVIGAGAAILVGSAIGESLGDFGLAGIVVAGFAAGAVSKDVVGGVLGAAGK